MLASTARSSPETVLAHFRRRCPKLACHYVMAVAVIAALPLSASAQSIELTGPVAPLVIPEGDEFFTHVIQDRIDFDKRRDFLWEENFSEASVVVSGGRWSGEYLDGCAYVFPLFPGFGDDDSTPLVNESALNAGNTGANFPIDTSKYTLVTYQDQVSTRTNRTLFWSQEVFWPVGDLFATAEDGFYTNTQNIKFAANTPFIAAYDLSGTAQWTATNAQALRIDSSVCSPAGTTVSYDWVRVSDPTSTDAIPITWSFSNVTPDLPGWLPRVSIFIDTDTTGFDGTLFASWEQLPGPAITGQGKFERPEYITGSYDLPGSALPPGEYYVYLQLWSNFGADSLLAQSGYSAKITIGETPLIELHAPSLVSGPDYATEVLGNPWDMSSADDIANLGNPVAQKNFRNESFAGGRFQAEAYIPASAPPSQIESDVQVWLNVDPSTPIDSTKYRYLTYVMEIDETGYGNISDKVSNEGGWVSRVVWWNDGIEIDGSATNDNVIYEGSRAYSVDLGDISVLEPADDFPLQAGWNYESTWSFFRIDPAEVNDPTIFWLDDVKLTGKPAPTRDQQYTVDFTVTDGDSSAVAISIFTSTDREGSGVQLVWGPQNLAPGRHEVTLNTAGWGSSDLFLSVRADDGVNVSETYSVVPITFAYTDGGSTQAPGTPTITSASPSTGELLFTVSTASAEEIVTALTVECSAIGQSATSNSAAQSPITVSGLSDNIAYSCVARASNGSGVSADSVPVIVKAGVDSDGDGVIDVDDAFPEDAEESADSDGDGLGDNREVELGTNPSSPDSDNDGYTDGEEVLEGTDPLDATDSPLTSGLPVWLLIRED